MRNKKVLVIDDSATIRRLVDSYLSPEGYQVTLAATAEDGLRLFQEIEPDLILLDHQLPGTTGYEVCRRLMESPRGFETPVVVSSTLRKKAYVEYSELPNVVDMLPKPYTAELLKTTVANALDTGALVVESQKQGTAVPEVIDALAEPELSGTFRQFRLREVLDFLNNSGQRGLLEVEAEYRRTFFYLDGGRIQGVSATGVDAQALAERLPPTLQSLLPVLNLTVAGRSAGELDGILELLDRKILDPRLLRNLLRHQAALLTFDCFTQDLRQFRFQSGNKPLPLQRKLPLEVSLAALLIDAALLCDPLRLPAWDSEGVYARRVIRGQNLDRAGTSAQHMKLVTLLAEPRSAEELTRQLGWQEEELRRVLYGLILAELVELQARTRQRQIVVYEPNAASAQELREFLESGREPYCGKVVRDRLALQLVLKRTQPDAIVFCLDGEDSLAACRELYRSARGSLPRTKWLAVVPPDNHPNPRSSWTARLNVDLDAVVVRPCGREQLVAALNQSFGEGPAPAPGTREAIAVAGISQRASEQHGSNQHESHLCGVQA